jgi:hypothetical protein
VSSLGNVVDIGKSGDTGSGNSNKRELIRYIT